MNDDREFWAATTDWLEEGSDRTPPPAIDAVLLAIRTTRQERVLWSPWRNIDMTLFARVAIAAAAVVVLAVGWVNLAPDGGGGGTSPTPSPSPTPAPISSSDQALEPGRYVFVDPPSGLPATLHDTFPRMSFTVPAGWTGNSATLGKDYGEAGPAGPFLWAWYFDRGFTDPCTDHTPVQSAEGSGAAGLISVIADQPGIDAGVITDVTVGGYAGKAVDYTVTTDPATCGNGEDGFWIWGSEDDRRFGVSLNDPERVYVIDVDGTMYAFFTNEPAGISAADRAELEAIIDSIEFEP